MKLLTKSYSFVSRIPAVTILLLAVVSLAFSIDNNHIEVTLQQQGEDPNGLKLLQDITRTQNLIKFRRERSTCIDRGLNCDDQPYNCCDLSVCRCNLWGVNCRCRRKGLF